MKKLIYLLVLAIAIVSCRKDKYMSEKKPISSIFTSAPVPLISHCIGDYDLYSTDSFDYVKQPLDAGFFNVPYLFFKNNYLYASPVFNPNNPYEIIYVREDATQNATLDNEIWKFSFCTGEATLIANNFYYNLDWGSNGWIIYTGTGHRIHKIKDNGDSLTALSTQSGYNRAGKWNPSATLYWNNHEQEFLIKDKNGVTVSTVLYLPIDWINDSIVLTLGTGNVFNTLNVFTGEMSLLNSTWVPPIQSRGYVLDKLNGCCYVTKINGLGYMDYYLKYDLKGTNQVDTLANLYDSYRYTGGDVTNNKIITLFGRREWADSTVNTQYLRLNILLMDLDATNERIVNIPE